MGFKDEKFFLLITRKMWMTTSLSYMGYLEAEGQRSSI